MLLSEARSDFFLSYRGGGVGLASPSQPSLSQLASPRLARAGSPTPRPPRGRTKKAWTASADPMCLSVCISGELLCFILKSVRLFQDSIITILFWIYIFFCAHGIIFLRRNDLLTRPRDVDENHAEKRGVQFVTYDPSCGCMKNNHTRVSVNSNCSRVRAKLSSFKRMCQW